jgi:hypothetical protein
VQLSDCIYKASIADGEHGHVEAFIGFTWVMPTAAHIVEVKACLACGIREVVIKKRAWKDIKSSRDRRVGCKDISRFGDRRGQIGCPLMLLHTLSNPLESQKCAMAFVHMTDCGSQTKDIEGTKAANAKEELLLDAGFLVTTVEIAGNPLIGLVVFRNKGIEENQLHTADICNPDAAANTAIGKCDIDCVASIAQREVFWMHGRIVFDLPAVVVDILAEIALSVEKAYGGQRDTKVTGCFAVVTGKHTQSTAINGETFRDSKLSGEVRDAVISGKILWLVCIPPGLTGEICFQLCRSGIEALEE